MDDGLESIIIKTTQTSLSLLRWWGKGRLGRGHTLGRYAGNVLTDKKLREMILNPNEDDIEESTLEELSEKCNLMSLKYKQESKNTSCQKHLLPTFEGDCQPLEPSSLAIPESIVDETISVDAESNLIRLIISLTNSDVTKEIVKSYLSCT